MENVGDEKMTVTGIEEDLYRKLKETVIAERNLGEVQDDQIAERNPGV